MNRTEYLYQLANLLQVTDKKQELNRAFTHASFHKKETTDKNNSRYIFAGMYAFKGLVAQQLYAYTPGTGTQLQHILGNLFRNEVLLALYDKFEIGKLIRSDINFDVEKHKHIFVYGLLGFVQMHCTSDVQKQFISQYIFMPNFRLLEINKKNKDLLAQCNVLSHLLYGAATKIEIAKNASDQFQSHVTINAYCLANETSKGFRYARNKALKKALITLTDDLYFIESSTATYTRHLTEIDEIQRQKIAAAKEQKRLANEAKEAKKRAEKLIRAELKKNKAHEKEVQRLKAKASLKKRKEAQQLKEADRAAKMATMSTNKRRHLQDKAK